MLAAVQMLAFGLVLSLAGTLPAAEGVLGRWEGSWMNKGGQPNKLIAEIAADEGDETYSALFIAHFGQVGKYKVPLKGKRDGQVVRFGGKYDLGDAGGVFEWSGAIAGDDFSGKYSSPTDNGSFEMKCAPAPDDK